jgi:ArsR family metal-binding transcriptional regulator
MNRLTKDTEPMIPWTSKLKIAPASAISDDIGSAMEKIAAAKGLLERLPGLDCGSCGAPTCRAFAEDIALGTTTEEDCIFRMRERMQLETGETIADYNLPLPFRTEGD